MSLEMFSDALDVIYESLGVEAVLSVVTEGITVLDKTSGVDLEAGQGAIRRPTLTPAAVVRRAELTSVGITDLSDIVNAQITFNGVTWRIASHKPKPTPEGESKGELYLILRSN